MTGPTVENSDIASPVFRRPLLDQLQCDALDLRADLSYQRLLRDQLAQNVHHLCVDLVTVPIAREPEATTEHRRGVRDMVVVENAVDSLIAGHLHPTARAPAEL